MTTRVLIVDDHALFRDGMASLLMAWGMEAVGQASDGAEALEKARLLQPDIVLMDLHMPRMDGIEATRALRGEWPDLKIVVISVADDDESLFEAIRSGANGYVLKDTPGDQVGPMLAGIREGRTPLSSGLAARILDEFAGRHEAGRSRSPDADALTEREIEILRAVSEGFTNKEIAVALGISPNTVNFHMKNILSKLHLRNRAQAVAYAVRTGLANPPAS